MKNPLDSFVNFLEKKTPPDVCILCRGKGKIPYAGKWTRHFEDVCHLCGGSGKRKE